jgi:hypothetical protein
MRQKAIPPAARGVWNHPGKEDGFPTLPKKTYRKSMIRRIAFVIALLTVCCCVGRTGLAGEQNPLPRTILLIYDSNEATPLLEVRNVVERISVLYLNYLGMKVIYHDLALGLPDETTMRDVHGILTWLIDDLMDRAVDYCHWLEKQVLGGKKLVILGNPGLLLDKKDKSETPLAEVNRVFHALGLRYEGNWTDNPFVIRVVEKDSSMVEFERSLENEAGEYQTVRSVNPENKVYLALERTDLPDSKSAAVVTTPFGGYAQQGYEVFLEYLTMRMQWRIDPFRFYAEAFGLEATPRFDTTTAFGRRIFYTHIDGDGFRNVSQVNPLKVSGEIIYDEILKKVRFPVTASFISSDILPQYFGSEKTTELVKKIAALENIEIGIHGFSHPLNWRKMLTAAAIKNYSRSLASMPDEQASESAYGFGARVTVPWEDYLRREIAGAMEDVNGLLPSGKKVVINQWTGNCLPPEEAILMAGALGLKNINGGDSRYDDVNPSYTDVAPVVRRVGSARQNYASNANENIYTNLWTGPYGAYVKVKETFRQTETSSFVENSARRVSPVNVYYHYYSGERSESLKALKQVYDYALAQDVIPIFTSEYAGIVDDFHRAAVASTGDGGWSFSGYGSVRTVRFDRETKFPDLERSSNVIGFIRWKDCLYVHLNNAEKAVLYFSERPPARPHLKSASAWVWDWQTEGNRLSFVTRVNGEARYILKQLSLNKTYSVKILDPAGQGEIKILRISSTTEGDLEISLRESGRFRVVVELR